MAREQDTRNRGAKPLSYPGNYTQDKQARYPDEREATLKATREAAIAATGMAAMKALTERANVVKTTQEAAIRAVNEQKANAKPTRTARKKMKEATWTSSFKRMLAQFAEQAV